MQIAEMMIDAAMCMSPLLFVKPLSLAIYSLTRRP